MGDSNQIRFLKQVVPSVQGPVLEIGSKDYGSTSSFRDVFSGNEYLGIDMEEGKGVDAVIDLEKGIGGLKENYFALGVCCSVLEHVQKPWKMAENITRVIVPGGLLYMSVPWVWRYHAYPDDYFRFSFRGIISLFPEFEWSVPYYYSTNVEGEFIPIRESNLYVDDSMAIGKESTTDEPRKYLPCLMVNMLGRKKQQGRVFYVE